MNGANYKYTASVEPGNFKYQIEIVQADADSVWSDARAVKVKPACPAAPAPVSPADGAAVSGPKIDLAWENDACGAQWTVVVRADNPKGEIVFKQTGLDAPNIKTKKLEPDRQYV